ncbi:MAG: DUF6295 family protein [Dehalococcoidia bacterium]
MCTNIVERVELSGSGKGPGGWFALSEAAISYDHPFHADEEHAVNIDFVNPGRGVDARVPVELSLGSARKLAEALLAMVDEAEAFERG